MADEEFEFDDQSLDEFLDELYEQLQGQRPPTLRVNCARKPRIDPEQVLVDWARHTGYSAVWLPDGLVRIPPAEQAIGGGASVICPSCGARWQDSRPGFWEQVRGHGYFPDRCSLCGGPLPEWLVLELGS